MMEKPRMYKIPISLSIVMKLIYGYGVNVNNTTGHPSDRHINQNI